MTRFAELRQRLLFLLGCLIVYRIGTFVPVPGIDSAALARYFEEQSGTLLGMFNMQAENWSASFCQNFLPVERSA